MLAWVLIAGRNTDGSEYRFSECWARNGNRWLQRSPATPEDLELLPPSFAPPLGDFEIWQDKMVRSLLGDPVVGHAPTPAANPLPALPWFQRMVEGAVDPQRG